MTGVVGISVGVTGIIATYKTGQQGRQHAETLARQKTNTTLLWRESNAISSGEARPTSSC